MVWLAGRACFDCSCLCITTHTRRNQLSNRHENQIVAPQARTLGPAKHSQTAHKDESTEGQAERTESWKGKTVTESRNTARESRAQQRACRYRKTPSVRSSNFSAFSCIAATLSSVVALCGSLLLIASCSFLKKLVPLLPPSSGLLSSARHGCRCNTVHGVHKLPSQASGSQLGGHNTCWPSAAQASANAYHCPWP